MIDNPKVAIFSDLHLELTDEYPKIIPTANLLILAGDTPLLRHETLAEFVSAHAKSKNLVSVLTAELPDPTG